MARHNITIGLSPKSIDIAIKELRKYKEYLRKKTDELVKALAESGIPVIDESMGEANYTYDENGVRSGSDTSHYSYVKMESFGNVSRAKLIVEGKELLFIEFGAGVYYNGPAGTAHTLNGRSSAF